MTMPEGCECTWCRDRYKMDLMVEDSLWEKIKRDDTMLCPTCIAGRVSRTVDYAAFALVDVDEIAQMRRTASTLPWRPIADLPVGPEFIRIFVIFDDDSPEAKMLRWERNAGEWQDELEGIKDHVVRNGFTHFIEITPP